MDPYIRLNIRPNFKQEKLPCDGKVGDLLILTPLGEEEYDSSPNGLASLWVCIKGSWEREKTHAVWARVKFDGVASCEYPVPKPPQDHPRLTRG